MFSFLGEKINRYLQCLNLEDIYEIRVRANKPLFLLTKSGQVFLDNRSDLVLTENDLNKTLIILTEHSIYAHLNTLKQGYITIKNGLRIGVSGQCVVEDDIVKIIKNVTSLSIRLPHQKIGCSNGIFEKIYKNGLKNLLIISPPSGGKTTLLRDIIRNLSYNYKFNILVVDERNEISGYGFFDVGPTCDILTNSTKNYGFTYGIRTMNPQVIATDELMNSLDVSGVLNAVFSGVKVIVTIHGESVLDVKRKQIFKSLFDNNVFDYAVILKNYGKEKRVEYLYDT